MQPWLETLFVTGLAIIGVVSGFGISRLNKPWWLIGYAISLIMLLLVVLCRNINALRFVPVFSIINSGRNEFTTMAFAAPMLLTILIGRLTNVRQKIAIAMLIVVSSIQFVIFPFLVPALIQKKLSQLPQNVTTDGICIQSTDYTCGPAAAVTALAHLGIEAREGEIAVWARTTSHMGTPDDMLARAIEKHYSKEGISCQYRYFVSIEELKMFCPTIAVIKYGFLIDHYVTVLEVLDDKVVIGDPLEGKCVLTFDEFKRKWRSIGIVVRRKRAETN